MAHTNRTAPSIFTSAVEAIAALFEDGFNQLRHAGVTEAIFTHGELEEQLVPSKSVCFYRRFVPLRNEMISLIVNAYRGFFKLAIANPTQTGNDPDLWTRTQLTPAVFVAFVWIHDWYILACEGESQSVQRVASLPFVPGQTVSVDITSTAPPLPTPISWRAPSWLFQISAVHFGIGKMKNHHVPARDSEERLGESHTRLLMKGARRVFLWQLGAAIERARNEEIAAAGALRTQEVSGQRRSPNKRKGWQQRRKLYECIQTVLSVNPSLEGIEFCAELDKRHAPPLFDWLKAGDWREGLTWKEAWRIPKLKRKIRRVRQEALKIT